MMSRRKHRRFQIAKWKRHKDGTVSLRPKPRLLEPITVDMFGKGCRLLGLDPDAVLEGSQQLADVPRPPLKSAEAFLDLVLQNASAYALGRMPVDRADVLLATVTAHFIWASWRRLTRPTAFANS